MSNWSTETTINRFLQSKHIKVEPSNVQLDSIYVLFSTTDIGSKDVIIDMINSGVETIFENFKKYTLIKSNGFTKEKCLLRHNGLDKWNEYTKFQGDKNTESYLGKEKYEELNKRKCVTLENQIKKYGEIIGTERFESYVIKQRSAGISLEYFQEKFGDSEGEKFYKDLNKRKGLTLENFITKYGEKIGKRKYIDACRGKNIGFSKKSQIFFDKLFKLLDKKDQQKCYYANLNHEFGKLNVKLKQYYRYDFAISNKKIIIEYNGDHYHANPKIYKSGDIVTKLKGGSKLADAIWEYDKIKQDFVKTLGFKVLIVWDSDCDENINLEIDKVLKEINYD